MLRFPDEDNPKVVDQFTVSRLPWSFPGPLVSWARVNCSAAELVDALGKQVVPPGALFEWAIARRAMDLVGNGRASVLWDDYVAHLGDFSAQTRSMLLRRAKL